MEHTHQYRVRNLQERREMSVAYNIELCRADVRQTNYPRVLSLGATMNEKAVTADSTHVL